MAVAGLFRFNDRTTAEIIIQREATIRRETQVPVRQARQGQVGCLCCYAGNVEFVAKVPRTGYRVADKIPLTVDVENNSTKEIRMEARILRRVTFYVYHNTCTAKETMARVSSDPISPRDTVTWSPDNLVVRAVLPALEGCRIINVEYKLSVVAIMPNSLDLVCDIPLSLGMASHTSSLGQADLERVLIPILRQPLTADQTSQTCPTNLQAAVSGGTNTTSVPPQTASDDDVDDHPYNLEESDALLKN